MDELELKDMEYLCHSGWIRIGLLSQIRMYPLETGRGFKVREAICTKSGLQSFSLNRGKPKSDPMFRYFDRVFVPFTYTENRYSIINNPTVADCTNRAVLRNAQRRASMIDGRGWISKIDYLGEIIELFNINCSLKYPTEGIFGEVGYISQKNRKTFCSQYRASQKNLRGDIFFSRLYPYTLQNTTTLNSIRRKNEGSRKILSLEKLCPNLVIEANTPYCEDEIVALRIGEKARFANVVPCTHDLEECDYEVVAKAKQTEFINKLKKTRSLKTKYPYLSNSSDLAVLGINLEIVQQGKIHLNDDVYAKFRDFPSSHYTDEFEGSDMEIDEEEL